MKDFLIIPYEEREFQDQERAVFLKFERPLKTQPPLLIAHDLKEKTISLNQKNFVFYIDSSLSNSDWEKLKKNIETLLKRYEREVLAIPFKRLFFFFHVEEQVLPLSIFLKKAARENLSWKILFSLLNEKILRYGLYLEDKNLIKALSLYFSSYKFAEDKAEYRKNLIQNISLEAKAFFYFYENLDKSLGEDKFEEDFKAYYERFLVNASSVKPAEQYLEEILNFRKFEPESFKKIDLKVKEFEIFPVDEKKGYKLKLLVAQEGTFRPLKIKLKISGEQFEKEETIFLNKESESFEFFLEGKPKVLVLDPEYKIYRALSYRELSFTFETLYKIKFQVYIPKKEYYPLYRPLIEKLRPNILNIFYSHPEIKSLPKENLLFIHNPPLDYHQYFPEEGLFFKILPHPVSQEHFIAFLRAQSTKEIKNLLNLEDHLKIFSEFHIQGKKIIHKKRLEATERGISVKVSEKTLYGLKPLNFEPFEKIFPELLASQIILIGENHDEYSHHLFQLELIKNLHHYHPQLAIGLEMVQIPFQKYLDEFIEGKLDEREFLEKIEYYERWGYDYRLYRDIFLFAKEKKIKLLALDLPSEMIKKVFNKGIQSLSGEEKLLLPELDLYRPEYRVFLEEVFKKHEFHDNKTNFEYFFQAQVLRDENMAERAIEFLRKNPSYKMVILVGKGHLLYGYGIPASLKRRNFHNFKTIVLGEVEKFKPGLSDYWFLPDHRDFKPSPKLGVILEEEKEGLRVKEVLKGSLAEKAGIMVGDILVKAEGKDLKKISDLKLVLTFKKEMEILKLELLRKTEKIYLQIKIE